MRGMKRRAFFLAFAIALIAAAYGGYRYFATNGKQTTYKFATVESGPLTAAVSAAGTPFAVDLLKTEMPLWPAHYIALATVVGTIAMLLRPRRF